METTLRAYNRAGVRLGILPWSSLSRTIVRNDLGALTATVPRSLLDPAVLTDETYLRVAVNGVESADWYLLTDDGDDDADSGGAARPVEIGGTGVAAILEWGTVYSWKYDPVKNATNLLGLDPTYGFAQATPGLMLKTFIDKAKQRGCFPHLSYSFDADKDSAGVPWPLNYARTFDVGITVGKVLAGMAEDGWVDWEMVGFRLDVYAVDTVLAQDYPNSILRLGQGVTTAPRKRTRTASRSVLLAVGAEGNMIEVTDPAAVGRLGRREGYDARSGITDVGTLVAASQVSLGRQANASEAITLEVEASSAPPLPRPGGFIRYDRRRLSANELEPMRVQSIAWDYAEPRKVSIELNDLWLDRDIRTARRVDAILNGSGSSERVPVNNPADRVPPAVVTGLNLESAIYRDPATGRQSAQVTANWNEVKKDADGSTVDEMGGYTIEWKQTEVSDAVYRVPAIPSATVASWSPVVPGVNVQARIAAYDRYNNYGAWSAWVTKMAGLDITPPGTPTKPAVDNRLGMLRIYWDGKFAGGVARPADLTAVEVHLSKVAGFGIGSTSDTVAGTLYTSGYVYAQTPYGEKQYVKFVAVDSVGNRSSVSVEASGATGQVVSPDLFDGVLDDSRLVASVGLFKTANILSLNLNDGVVSTLSVGKLSAGTIGADILMGGRIYTAAPGVNGTAKRVELNGAGIYRWDGVSTTPVVSIDNNGALLTGIYRTANSGRRIEMGSAGREGRLDFYAPAGDNGFVRAYTEPGTGSIEAIQIGMIPSGWASDRAYLWNRLNINSSPNGDYSTFKSGTLELTYDSYGVNSSGSFMVWQTGGERGLTGTGALRFISNKTEVKSITAGNYITVRSDVVEMYTGGAKVTVSDPNVRFWFSDTSYLRVDNGTASSSAKLVMGNTSGFSGLLKYWYDSTTGAFDGANSKTWPQIQSRTGDDAAWIRFQSQGYDVSSDAAGKTEIRSVSRSLLEQVRATKVRSYKRKDRMRLTSANPDVPDRVLEAPVEIGLIAQEAPAQIRTATGEDELGIDLYQMAAMTWGALAELADRVDTLMKGTTK